MKSIICFFAFIACAFAGIHLQVPTVLQAPVAIPTIVKTGISHHPFHVPEHRFSRQDWETPGSFDFFFLSFFISLFLSSFVFICYFYLKIADHW